jgi:DNA-binding NtrC family response regulator
MPKILLIDRDISQGNSIANAIRKSPLEVAVVHSVEEAAAIVRREPFDLIFLDVVAEKEPLTAVRTVREAADAAMRKRAPLVVVAKSFSESAFLLDTAAVDVLLEIPVHNDQLYQIIEQFVGCKLK